MMFPVIQLTNTTLQNLVRTKAISNTMPVRDPLKLKSKQTDSTARCNMVTVCHNTVTFFKKKISFISFKREGKGRTGSGREG